MHALANELYYQLQLQIDRGQVSSRDIVAAISQAIWKACVAGLPMGPGNFCRFSMYKSLRAHFAAHASAPNGRILSISHSLHLADLIATKPFDVTEANFPETDILNMPFEDGTFDLVVSDQVFEHIRGGPQEAIDECFRVLKPGGRMVHTTGFSMPYHGPGDFWRFSPEGLAYLCRNASEIELAAGWGHPFVPVFSALGLAHARVPSASWHPFHWAATANRASYAFVVWIVARR